MIMLASQFRLMLQVKLMYKKGYSEKDMASTLAVHPYRVKLALSSNYDENELIKSIKKLYQLDFDIKTGKIDKNFGFELFLLS